MNLCFIPWNLPKEGQPTALEGLRQIMQVLYRIYTLFYYEAEP
jgi:hypothetical protein